MPQAKPTNRTSKNEQEPHTGSHTKSSALGLDLDDDDSEDDLMDTEMDDRLVLLPLFLLLLLLLAFLLCSSSDSPSDAGRAFAAADCGRVFDDAFLTGASSSDPSDSLTSFFDFFFSVFVFFLLAGFSELNIWRSYFSRMNCSTV